MKISIFGGGINGLTSALILNKFLKKSEITVYSKDLGGNFVAGGLKYLKYTEYTEKFMRFCVPNINWSIKNPIGSILAEGEIYNFPLYMYAVWNASELQKNYWIKTGRNPNEFDDRCMNDAYNFRTELNIELECNLNNFIRIIIEEVEKFSNIEFVDFDLELFNKSVNNSDIVIYTLPLSLLGGVIGKELKSKFVSSDLHIHKYKINRNLYNKIWFDYMYEPGDEYKFHRMSLIRNAPELHFEVNSVDNIDDDVDLFLTKYFGLTHTNKCGISNIKGQITTDVDIDVIENILPDNVILLGRFAEWNKRITWDDVVEKLFVNEKLSKLYIK